VRLLAMAAQLAPRLPLVPHGRDAVLRLEAVTGFGAYVAVPAYADVLVIACSGERGILPWALLPVLDDATGRMLLAHRREWRSSLAAEGRELGEGEVDETLKRGHVVVWRSGARIGSLAVAMPRPAGPPIAAIGLRGPGDELVAGERSLADLLRTAAARLARDTSDSWQPI
jgi:DNA-binding IclR family transcriptional regulator